MYIDDLIMSKNPPLVKGVLMSRGLEINPQELARREMAERFRKEDRELADKQKRERQKLDKSFRRDNPSREVAETRRRAMERNHREQRNRQRKRQREQALNERPCKEQKWVKDRQYIKQFLADRGAEHEAKKEQIQSHADKWGIDPADELKVLQQKRDNEIERWGVRYEKWNELTDMERDLHLQEIDRHYEQQRERERKRDNDRRGRSW